MNNALRKSRTFRLTSALAAVMITGVLFQSVASLSRPGPAEQLAKAKMSAVTVASTAMAIGQRPVGR